MPEERSSISLMDRFGAEEDSMGRYGMDHAVITGPLHHGREGFNPVKDVARSSVTSPRFDSFPIRGGEHH